MDSESAQERFEQLRVQLETVDDGRWQRQMERNQPTIVLEEDGDGYVVAFEMTAFDADTVSVHLEDRTLVLTADRNEAERSVRATSTGESASPGPMVVLHDAIRHWRRSRSPSRSSSPAST